MKKPKPAHGASHEEQPQRGGSYLRDPVTGKLTLFTEPEADALEEDTAGDPNPDAAAGGDAASASTDQEV